MSRLRFCVSQLLPFIPQCPAMTDPWRGPAGINDKGSWQNWAVTFSGLLAWSLEWSLRCALAATPKFRPSWFKDREDPPKAEASDGRVLFVGQVRIRRHPRSRYSKLTWPKDNTMPPRLRCPASRGLHSSLKTARIPSRPAALFFPSASSTLSTTRHYASAGAPTVSRLLVPADYIPPTKPPTARPADVRKSQLLRSYTSLLRSTPLMLIFQHNNLTAVEWAAIRRELRVALAEVPVGSDGVDVSPRIGIQVIRTRIFDVALKIIEFFDPSKVQPTLATTLTGKKVKTVYNHDLSEAAYKAIKTADKAGLAESNSDYAQLAPLMVGPLAVLTFPTVSPAHLAAALKILSPSPPAFPPPPKKKSPGYYDPIAQNGLHKLLLVGGRIEGKVFDVDGVQWVGGIEGGLDSLRAQLMHMLQSAGLGLTTALEGASKSLWLTMESRRSVLEEAEKGPEETAKPES